MRFSLVVATINRTVELEDLFVSLINQTYQNFEVIVVDQNEDDRLVSLISKFEPQLEIIHIRTPVKGASHARNLGIDRSSGDIITFPDDDCEYPVALLQDIKIFFCINCDVDVVSVSSKDKHGDGRIARLSNKKRKITKYNVLWSCIEFGIFAKSECLQGIKFDENMGVGSYSPWWSDEGPDLILHLLKKDKAVYYQPALYIYHPDPVKKYDRKSIVRSFRYGCGRGYYLRKHNYSFMFVLYVWSLYIAGMLMSFLKLDSAKVSYYYHGLKGRVLGYLRYREAIDKALDKL